MGSRITAVNKRFLQVGTLIVFWVVIFAGQEGHWACAQDKDQHGGRDDSHEIHFLQIKNEQNTITSRTEYEREKQQVTSSESPTRRSRLLLQEGLETDFRGSVYHPKFMDFDLSLEIAPEQDKEKSDAQTGDKGFRNSYLSHYWLNSRFLKEKPFNFSLFADNQREVVNRDFFERQIVDSSGNGGRFVFQNDNMPVNFSYNYTERNIDRSFRPDQNFKDETMNLHLDPQFIKLGDTKIDYTRNRYERMEAGASDQNGISDHINLMNRSEWGEDTRKNLTTYLRYFSLEDTRNSRNLTLDESLTLDHTDALQTLYRYNFSDNTVGTTDSTQQNLTWGLRHQLYESLNSAFTVNGTSLNTTSFDEKEINAALNEDYVKHIGAARLGLGVDYIFDRRNRSSVDTVLNVVNEPHQLDDATVVFLNQLNVDTSRITVADSTGTTIYTQDLDYQIIQHATGFTEIKRIATGKIANGDQVLVDYIVTDNSSFSFSTAQNNYRVTLGLLDNNLQFYARYRQQRHTNMEGAPNLILEEFDDRTTGCQLDLGWTNLKAEYEDYASDLNPYTAFRLSEDFTWNVSSKSLFTLRSSQDYVSLTDDKRESYDVRGKYSYRLTRVSVGTLENGYRRQKGKDTELENVVSRMTYQVNVGQLSFESGYEFEKEYSLGTDRDNHYVFTTLKRKF